MCTKTLTSKNQLQQRPQFICAHKLLSVWCVFMCVKSLLKKKQKKQTLNCPDILLPGFSNVSFIRWMTHAFDVVPICLWFGFTIFRSSISSWTFSVPSSRVFFAAFIDLLSTVLYSSLHFPIFISKFIF